MSAKAEAIEVGLGPLAKLYDEHSASAFRLAFLLTGDTDLAEDLVQDAFVKLIARFGNLRGPQAADAYIKRTVVNLSNDLFRHRRVERAYLARTRGSAGRSPDELPDVEGKDQLWMQLQRIAPRQRSALVLRYFEDLSEQQTADVLGCSLRTAKSLVARGMHAMRAQQEGEL